MPSFTIDPTLPANTEAIGGGLGASRIRNQAATQLELFGFTGGVAETFGSSPFGIDLNGLVTVQANPQSNLGIATKQYVDAAISTFPICTITNSGSAWTGTLVPGIGAYVLLAAYRVKWTNASQGNDTVAFNGLPALTVKKNLNGSLVNLALNDVPAGSTNTLIYDGTNLQISMGPVPTATSATIVDAQAGNPLADVVSSVVETSVYSKSVPGNTIPAQGMLRLTFNGDLLNNKGGGDTFRIKVKFGGTTVLDTGAQTATASANRGMVNLVAYIHNLNATNAQFVTGVLLAAGFLNTPPANGVLQPEGEIFMGEFTGLAVDTTTAQTLQVTCTLGSSSAQLEFRSFGATLEAI